MAIVGGTERGWRQDVERIVWTLLLAVFAVVAGIGVMWVAGIVARVLLEAAVPGGIGGIGWYDFVRVIAFILLGMSPPSALLGGYVAALAARRSAVGHALAVGIIQSFLVLSLGFPLVMAHPPLWLLVWYLATLVLVIPSALLGGRRGQRRKERRAAGAATEP